MTRWLMGSDSLPPRNGLSGNRTTIRKEGVDFPVICCLGFIEPNWKPQWQPEEAVLQGRSPERDGARPARPHRPVGAAPRARRRAAGGARVAGRAWNHP